jgi:UPF0755 protein
MKGVKIFFFLLFLGAAGYGAWWFYGVFYKPGVHVQDDSPFLYVNTGMTMDELTKMLSERKIVEDIDAFKSIAKLKKFEKPVAGRYRIQDGMNNRQLVNLLISGKQEPVKFTFNEVRTKEQLAGRVGGKLEADSLDILQLLEDEAFIEKYGFNEYTILTLFLPATYEMKWNTSAEEFFELMAAEYKTFWTDDRRNRASAMGFTQSEVVILASIVEAEQKRVAEERKRIAGLYINRLKKGMPLQSDPTVIYALGDFSINRVLKSDLDVNSPYNTYRNTGLPPGPILLADKVSIDAVLQYEKNDYLYMCAEYGTGKHKFTKDYDVHLKNAREYQAALDKNNIKR